MPTLYVPFLGRLGNMLFTMAHARKYCQLNGLELLTLPWIGERVFSGWPECPRPSRYNPDQTWPESYRQAQSDLIYSRKEVKEWFKLKPEFLEKLSPMDREGNTELILSVRDGQDHKDGGLACLSDESYRRAVAQFGLDINGARWLRYSKPETCEGFDTHRDGFGCNITTQPLPSLYRMMRAKWLFRAPSTFDWWGATLGESKVYAPVVRNIEGGRFGVDCFNWVPGNWPWMNPAQEGKDLYLRDDHTLEAIYQLKRQEQSDINEHLQTLAHYAAQCGHVTEFGVRGIVSTWGLLAGRPRRMVSYDQTHPGSAAIDNVKACAVAEAIDFDFILADVKNADIEETDLLFIDTYHTYSQLRAELEKHGGKVRRFIVLHDTETWGQQGEATSERGLIPAYTEWLAKNPAWRVREIFHNNNGLTVLEKRQSDGNWVAEHATTTD